MALLYPLLKHPNTYIEVKVSEEAGPMQHIFLNLYTLLHTQTDVYHSIKNKNMFGANTYRPNHQFLRKLLVKQIHWGTVTNMSLSEVVKMPILLAAKKRNYVLLLSLPNAIGPTSMQAPLNGRSISHSSKNPW